MFFSCESGHFTLHPSQQLRIKKQKHHLSPVAVLVPSELRNHTIAAVHHVYTVFAVETCSVFDENDSSMGIFHASSHFIFMKL